VQDATTFDRVTVKYPPHSPLRDRLIRSVDRYFRERDLRPQGGMRMVVKSASILSWWLLSYLLLVFWASSWWQTGILVVSLGLAVAGVGFNIQHDGGHGSYVARGLGNRLSSWTLDLMGGSSYLWHFKHNILHHHYTNLDGVDDDLDAGPLLRLAEAQRRRWFHRLQHWYIWPLYAFLPPKWQFYDDWKGLITGRIGDQPFPRPRGGNLAVLIAGKLLFTGWALALPLALHPTGVVLSVYALCCLGTGIVLGTVFQLAHCVEEASFPLAPGRGERVERSWAEHQIATTVDFAPRSRWLSWYLGGLNFQVEHHLFPRISHLHYPAIAPIVKSVCAESGIRHVSHDTIWSALRSHVRYLKRLGCTK